MKFTLSTAFNQSCFIDPIVATVHLLEYVHYTPTVGSTTLSWIYRWIPSKPESIKQYNTVCPGSSDPQEIFLDIFAS